MKVRMHMQGSPRVFIQRNLVLLFLLLPLLLVALLYHTRFRRLPHSTDRRVVGPVSGLPLSGVGTFLTSATGFVRIEGLT
jgi:hypothetical protein